MYSGIVLVTTDVDFAGQFVTVDGQAVMVSVCVVYTTDVVMEIEPMMTLVYGLRVKIESHTTSR